MVTASKDATTERTGQHAGVAQRGVSTTVSAAVLKIATPFTLRELAEATGLTVSAVNGPVHRWVKEGRLERVELALDDPRAQHRPGQRGSRTAYHRTEAF